MITYPYRAEEPRCTPGVPVFCAWKGTQLFTGYHTSSTRIGQSVSFYVRRMLHNYSVCVMEIKSSRKNKHALVNTCASIRCNPTATAKISTYHKLSVFSRFKRCNASQVQFYPIKFTPTEPYCVRDLEQLRTYYLQQYENTSLTTLRGLLMTRIWQRLDIPSAEGCPRLEWKRSALWGLFLILLRTIPLLLSRLK